MRKELRSRAFLIVTAHRKLCSNPPHAHPGAYFHRHDVNGKSSSRKCFPALEYSLRKPRSGESHFLLISCPLYVQATTRSFQDDAFSLWVNNSFLKCDCHGPSSCFNFLQIFLVIKRYSPAMDDNWPGAGWVALSWSSNEVEQCNRRWRCGVVWPGSKVPLDNFTLSSGSFHWRSLDFDAAGTCWRAVLFWCTLALYNSTIKLIQYFQLKIVIEKKKY